MTGCKQLLIKILYWSGILLILRLAWVTYVMVKVFPIACLLLASFLGMFVLFEQ
jgi:hypothetical protein